MARSFAQARVAAELCARSPAQEGGRQRFCSTDRADLRDEARSNGRPDVVTRGGEMGSSDPLKRFLTACVQTYVHSRYRYARRPAGAYDNRRNVLSPYFFITLQPN